MAKQAKGPLGALVRRRREDLGATQEQLGSKMDRSKSWVANVERWKTTPTKRPTVQALAEALELSFSDVWAAAMKSYLMKETPQETLDRYSEAFLNRFAEKLEQIEDVAESIESLDSPIDPSLPHEESGPDRTHLAPVPPKRREQLEDFGQKVAQQVWPIPMADGSAIPVTQAFAEDGLQTLQEVAVHSYPIRFRELLNEDGSHPEAQVEYTENGKIVIGIREDVLRRAENGDGRARFSCAHEIAHATFHGHKISRLNPEAGRVVLRDMHQTATDQCPEDVPIYKSGEYQANVIASSILMPFPSVRDFINANQSESRGIRIGDVADHFQVSQQAARIRIEQILPRLTSFHEENSETPEVPF